MKKLIIYLVPLLFSCNKPKPDDNTSNIKPQVEEYEIGLVASPDDPMILKNQFILKIEWEALEPNPKKERYEVTGSTLSKKITFPAVGGKVIFLLKGNGSSGRFKAKATIKKNGDTVCEKLIEGGALGPRDGGTGQIGWWYSNTKDC